MCTGETLRAKEKSEKANRLKNKLYKSEQKLRQVATGKYAVMKYFLTLKMKNYLMPITEQENPSYEQCRNDSAHA